MVDPVVRHPDTCTDHWYDVTKPVTYAEDQESRAIALDAFSDGITEQCDVAYHAGWHGWNREDLCPIPHLVDKMKKAFGEGDVVKVGVYLMMLHGRGVTNFEHVERQKRLTEVSEQIEKLIAAEETVAMLGGDDSAHARVIGDIRNNITRLDHERKKLIKQLG